MAENCNLDALLGILDDDDDDFEGQTAEAGQAGPSQDEKGAADDSDNDDEALRRQLQEMEQKMMEMKRKLKDKGEKSKPGRMAEMNMFDATCDARDRKLASPVKTNPLKEAERPQKAAKYEPQATKWCPSLIKTKTERTLSKEETKELRERLAKADAEKDMARIARQDLADSSDDDVDEEGNSIYNECGREIKKRLARAKAAEVAAEKSATVDRIKSVGVSTGFVNKPGSQVQLGKAEKKSEKGSLMLERHSGMRLSRPLVTQLDMDSAVRGRRVVTMNTLPRVLIKKEIGDTDWVTFGAVYFKGNPKTSSNGNDYVLWKLTDLKGSMDPVALFLFGRAYKEHWKIPLNKVVGILNPKIMEDKAGKGKGEITLSIDHPDKLLEMGDSADAGKCVFKKPSGNTCTNIVNLSVCEYCTYHVKRAYKETSAKRSALQSSFSGGPDASRARIMNKMMGKDPSQYVSNEGPVIGKQSRKQIDRDNRLLAGLGPTTRPVNSGFDCYAVFSVDKLLNQKSSDKLNEKKLANISEEQKDVVRKVAANVSGELAARLLAPTPGARAILNTFVKEDKKEKEKLMPKAPAKSAKELLLEHRAAIYKAENPKLGRGLTKSGEVSLEISPSVKANFNASRARSLALLKLKSQPIAREDPNKSHRSKFKQNTPKLKDKIKKRVRSSSQPENDPSAANKRQRTDAGSEDDGDSDPEKLVIVFGQEVSLGDLKKADKAKSKNSHLVDEAELEATDKYFDKLEKREAMEEKMLSTFEMKVKAAKCLDCKYTAFSAGEMCKKEGHKLRYVDAVKRFFACKDCKKRTVSLDRLPQSSCKQCGGSKWVKAAMMREKKGPVLENEVLSIRGAEEKFLGGMQTPEGMNLNL